MSSTATLTAKCRALGIKIARRSNGWYWNEYGPYKTKVQAMLNAIQSHEDK